MSGRPVGRCALVASVGAHRVESGTPFARGRWRTRSRRRRATRPGSPHRRRGRESRLAAAVGCASCRSRSCRRHGRWRRRSSCRPATSRDELGGVVERELPDICARGSARVDLEVAVPVAQEDQPAAVRRPARLRVRDAGRVREVPGARCRRLSSCRGRSRPVPRIGSRVAREGDPAAVRRPCGVLVVERVGRDLLHLRAVGVRIAKISWSASGLANGHPVAVERELATVRAPVRSEVVGLGVARQGDLPGAVRLHRPDVEVPRGGRSRTRSSRSYRGTRRTPPSWQGLPR